MGVDLISKIIPKTLDVIIMWIIAFVILFLLFRKEYRAGRRG
jgi:hypothetical protein